MTDFNEGKNADQTEAKPKDENETANHEYIGAYEDDYIQELTEWQEHQYDPGHYVGGRIPHFVKYRPNPKYAVGINLVWILVGLLFLFPLIGAVWEGAAIVPNLKPYLLFSGLGVLLLWFGLSNLYHGKMKK